MRLFKPAVNRNSDRKTTRYLKVDSHQLGSLENRLEINSNSNLIQLNIISLHGSMDPPKQDIIIAETKKYLGSFILNSIGMMQLDESQDHRMRWQDIDNN